MRFREGKQTTRTLISWLGDLHQTDPDTIAVRQRELSDLLLVGLPVLPGFTVTGAAFELAVGERALQRDLAKVLAGIDWRNDKAVAAASRTLRRHMEKAALPAADEKTLRQSYDHLTQQFGGAAAVIATPSLAGPAADKFNFNAEPLVAHTAAELLKNIRACYRQLFSENMLTQELADALFDDALTVTVLVQPYVDARASGKLSTVDGVVIEAILGRPEPLLDRRFLADRYTVDLEQARVITRDCNRQTWELRAGGAHRKVARLDQSGQKLDEDAILELAKFAQILSSQHDFPVDLVWLQDEYGKLWIGAVSLTGKIIDSPAGSSAGSSAGHYNQVTVEPVVFGAGAGGGTAAGPVLLARHREDLARLTDKNILVVESLHQLPGTFGDLNLDDSGRLAMPAGIVSETGLISDIPADLHIPVVVGAKGALHKLADGQMVTVDGRHGTVAIGSGKLSVSRPNATVTGVKLYEHTLSLYAQPCPDSDGVGLLSMGLLYERLGIHPRHALSTGAAKSLQSDIVDELCVLATGRKDQPILLTTHDWAREQYRALPGGETHEPLEKNPLMGHRGGGRALRESDLFALELQALRQARDEYRHENLHLMLGFVRTIKELTALHHMVNGAGLRPGPHFKLWLLAQVPANLTLLRRVADRGLIQGVCFDLDSLTQLLLGADTENEELAGEYDICDPTVLETVAEAIAVARKAGLSVTAAGKTLADHPEAIEALVAAGVTGIVLDPSDIADAHQLVASIEQRLILDHLTV